MAAVPGAPQAAKPEVWIAMRARAAPARAVHVLLDLDRPVAEVGELLVGLAVDLEVDLE